MLMPGPAKILVLEEEIAKADKVRNNGSQPGEQLGTNEEGDSAASA